MNPCSIDEDDCDDSAATCEHTGPGTHNCTCFGGFETVDSGVTCAEIIDECESSPCENGGTCVDAVLAFTCECADGYEGPHCNEQSILSCVHADGPIFCVDEVAVSSVQYWPNVP